MELVAKTAIHALFHAVVMAVIAVDVIVVVAIVVVAIVVVADLMEKLKRTNRSLYSLKIILSVLAIGISIFVCFCSRICKDINIALCCCCCSLKSYFSRNLIIQIDI